MNTNVQYSTAYLGQGEFPPGRTIGTDRSTSVAFLATLVDGQLATYSPQFGSSIVTFLFDASWPIRAQLWAGEGGPTGGTLYQKVDTDAYAALPDYGSVSVGAQVAWLPPDAFVAIEGQDALHPIPRGRGVSGRTKENNVPVRGHVWRFPVQRPSGAPEPFVEIPGGQEATGYRAGYVSWQTRTKIQLGDPYYVGNNTAEFPVQIPCLLAQEVYTQAMKDAGDVLEASQGGTFFRIPIAGLFAPAN